MSIEERFQFLARQRVQHDEPLAFLSVGHAGDDKFLLGRAGEFVQFFFDLDVRHHFAADFAEAAQAVGDCEEAVLVLAAMSPVTYQPSRRTSAVFSGLPR